MKRRLLFSLVALVLACLSGHAQSYRFLTSDNELPSSMINDLFQDHYGFVWIATENGLVRYDGARFVTFTNIPSDDHSLAHDFVTSLVEDRDGHLYISTYAGVQVFDYATNTFTQMSRGRMAAPLVRTPTTFSSTLRVRSIRQDIRPARFCCNKIALWHAS